MMISWMYDCSHIIILEEYNFLVVGFEYFSMIRIGVLSGWFFVEKMGLSHVKSL